MTPNAFAWLALGAWPLVVLAVYATRREAGLARTTAWMLVLPALFLPSNLFLNVPGAPDLDKYRIGTLSIVVALELFHTRPAGEVLRAHRFARAVLAALAWGAFQTARTNPDALTYGPTRIPGLIPYDAVGIAAGIFLDFYLPFAIAERVFRTERDVEELFEVLTLGALIYLPLCAIELRLSPQLHRWVYGYHPSEFLQAMRAGGFRPVVFMNHGLSVSMFLFAAFCAALALARARAALAPTPRVRAVLVGAFLVLSKGFGATLYGAAVGLSHGLASARAWSRAALMLALLVVAYPALRAADAFPADRVVDAFSRVSPERAASLDFRFTHEEMLLSRMRERPVFGWGSWGRNQVFAPWGGQLTVGDSFWVLLLGTQGILGFAGIAALLMVPVYRFAGSRSLLQERAQLLGGALALLVAVFTLDLIPNSQLGYFQFALAGALYGVAGEARSASAAEEPAEAAA